MPVGYMGGTKRARSIPSLVSSNQGGGVKKAGSVSRYHAPRNNWMGGSSQRKSLFAIFPTINAMVAAGKVTMRPMGAGGVGRYPGAAGAVRSVSSHA